MVFRDVKAAVSMFFIAFVEAIFLHFYFIFVFTIFFFSFLFFGNRNEYNVIYHMTTLYLCKSYDHEGKIKKVLG